MSDPLEESGAFSYQLSAVSFQQSAISFRFFACGKQMLTAES